MPEEADTTSVDTAAVMDFFANSGAAPEDTPDTPSVDPVEPAATEVEQTPTTDPLGPDPDLSDLTPEARAFAEQRILQLRQGFTKRTTELADANRVLEAAGGNPEALLEAFNFQQALADPGPEGDDARARLYQALNAQYGNQPNQAIAPTPEVTPDDPFSEFDLPPEIRDALVDARALKEEFAAIRAERQEFAQQQAQQQYLQEVVDDLTGDWNKLVEARPDIEDAQDYIFALGAHTGGNLLEAMSLYDEIGARERAKLFEGAVNVPGGVTSPPAGGGHSTEPVEIEDFKQAGAAAEEFLKRAYSEIN